MSDLEKELKDLQPRKLSAHVVESIRREVGSSQPARPAEQDTADGSILFWGRQLLRAAAVLAVAAGLAALLFSARHDGPVQQDTIAKAPEPATVTNEPSGAISVSTVLVDQQDEGTIVDPRYGPVRRVRCRFVDNIRWDHPREGGAVIRQTPREEIVLVSVPVD